MCYKKKKIYCIFRLDLLKKKKRHTISKSFNNLRILHFQQNLTKISTFQAYYMPRGFVQIKLMGLRTETQFSTYKRSIQHVFNHTISHQRTHKGEP